MNIVIAIVAAIVIGIGGYFWYSGSTKTETTPPPAAEPTPAPTPEPTPTPSPVPPATSARANVDIQGYLYNPRVITVKRGTTVTWTNKDTMAHTVTSLGANLTLNSALFGVNQSYSYTFNTVGIFEYYCKPHPYMKGTVVVTN